MATYAVAVAGSAATEIVSVDPVDKQQYNIT